MFLQLKISFVLSTLLFISACATQPTPPEAPAQPPVESPAVIAPAAPTPLKIVAVGDIMLDGTARPVLSEKGYDYPFVHMRKFFDGAQVVFGNLEGPLTTRGKPEQEKTYVFRSPPDKVSQALKNAGFNVVSLANNHTLDYGADGLTDTMQALDSVGIAHTGAGATVHEARRPVMLNAVGKRIAILAYSLTLPENFYAGSKTPGTAFGHEAFIRSDVEGARRQADIVLVSFHWGQEGKTSLRDYQTRLGRLAIDAGAVAVLGHHPHILQGVERYKDGVILYSLGNFTFGSYSNTAKVSAVAELIFADEGLATLRLYPINVNNFEVVFQPQPLIGAAATSVVDTLRNLSTALKTELIDDNGTALLRLR